MTIENPIEHFAGTVAEDPIAAVLHDLRLSNSYYCRSELSSPWGLAGPKHDYAFFHFLIEGKCWLRMNGMEPLEIQAGDLALLPRGDQHINSDTPSRAVDPIETVNFESVGENSLRLIHGGGGKRTLLICGGVYFDPPTHPLLEMLPSLITIRSQDKGAGEWVQSILTILDAEATSPYSGSETIITRLTDVLVMGAIRRWLQTSTDEQNGWLHALRDEQIGRAIALIHRKPDHPWTVESLATAIYMSRSGFALRFSELVGKSPMQYLSEWRMHQAGVLLRQKKLTLGEVAYRLSYGSEAAFSRAFKRHWGVPPSTYRRTTAVM